MWRGLCLFERKSYTCEVGDTEFREESTGRSLIDKRGSDSVVLLAITTEPTRHLAADGYSVLRNTRWIKGIVMPSESELG